MAWTWTDPEILTEPWNAPYGREPAGEDPGAQYEEDWLDDATVLFAVLLGIA